MPSKTFEWFCKDRSLDKINKRVLQSKETKSHPLKVGIKSSSASNVFVIQDPLSSTLDGIDPLSQFNQEQEHELSPSDETPTDEWVTRKAVILSKYTTDEKLSMTSSYLYGGEKAVKVESTTTIKKRLEQLDAFEEGSEREMGDLSQSDYVKQIEALKKEMKQAWNTDQRVKALKITIQCSKLLVDTTAITFYPSKFVLIADVLDLFGELVFDRLRSKAEYYPPNSPLPTQLPIDFTSSMVPEAAKETCRNWFFKIASIRELVPRIYVELSILKCYRFLMDGEVPKALHRLTRMIRGIGDPLVAAFVRCYLCHISATLNLNQFFILNYNEFLLVYPHILNKCVLGDLIVQKVDISSYMCLYSPALDWMLNIKYISSSQLNDIFEKSSSMHSNALLINSILNSCPKYFIVEKCSQIINLISNCGTKDISQYILWTSLGHQLLDECPDDPLEIFNGVWEHISQIKDPSRYISCAKVWVKFILKHFSSIELNWFLGDIIQHMTTSSRIFEHHSTDLALIMNSVVQSSIHILSILAMQHVLQYLELLKDDFKMNVCKNIIKALNETSDPIRDIVIVNTIMTLCTYLHNSLNALSVQDERRQVSELICNFVYRVQFINNHTQQLSFYVNAREAFNNLDSVLIALVHCVNKLSMDPNSQCSKACAAYCFITIPSVECIWTQLQLYYLSAQVALVNKCLGQVDAIVKAAISLILENKPGSDADNKIQITEQMVLSYIRQMLSFLLIVPDNPEQSILYLTKALIKGISIYPWSSKSSCKAEALMSVLDMLSAARQEVYPYKIKNVDSNNILYGSDTEFLTEIDTMCTQVLEMILEYMQEDKKHQNEISLQLFIRSALYTETSNNTLASNLLKLSRKNKHNSLDEELITRNIEYLKRKYPSCAILS